jgi:hypothetical protein
VCVCVSVFVCVHAARQRQVIYIQEHTDIYVCVCMCVCVCACICVCRSGRTEQLWYAGTALGAAEFAPDNNGAPRQAGQVLSVLALLVQKYKY